MASAYHPVLVLLRGVVNGHVPGVGAASIDFANVQHPVPAVRGGKVGLMLTHVTTHKLILHSLGWSSKSHVVFLKEREVSEQSVFAWLEDL